tara:strand:- start:3601 stop:4482 length:882 start_codon:yes stop_codon:yes gene_type:complete
MDALINPARDALTGAAPHTAESATTLIDQLNDGISELKSQIGQDDDALDDVTQLDAHPEIELRLEKSKRVLRQLSGALPKLQELKDQLIKTDRDETQQVQYAHMVKQRKAVNKVLEEGLKILPAFAQALQQAAKLGEAATRFNRRPTPGTPVNPMDVMVSDYEYLPPLIADAVLKNTQLVDADGKTIFAPIGSSVSMPPPLSVTPQSSPSKSYLHDEMQYAQEMRSHDAERLQKLKQEAAQRGAPDLAQVAAVQGITGDQLKRMEDSANGKSVSTIQTKIDVEMERRKQNARG